MFTYEFKLYPNKAQRLGLENSLEHCRQAYNHLLEMLCKQKSSRSEIQHELVELKMERPEFNSVYSKVLQYEPYRLFSNLGALSQLKKHGKKVGRLRFKSKEHFKTFSYNQSGFKFEMLKPKKGVLHLSKIGDIKVKAHRRVEGKIKQVTLKKRIGKWFAFLITDATSRRTCGDRVLGIDLGINNYVVDSDGNKIPHPHNIDKYAKELASAQRELARKERGSNNRKKAKLRVARVYDKVVRCRKDFLHKLSDKYVKGCRTIVVEKLNVKGLMRSAHNARNIADASWATFVEMLRYKAASAGCEVAEVDPKNTTKTCSKCGSIKEMPLWQRTYACGNCGVELDRDYNSSLNILNKYLGREPTLVGKSPSTREIWHGGSMKQEALLGERRGLLRDAPPFRAE